MQNVATKSYLTKHCKVFFDQGQTANTPKKLFLMSKSCLPNRAKGHCINSIWELELYRSTFTIWANAYLLHGDVFFAQALQ